MIEVIFKAESISDLKLQIQEYSLAHLGLNFKGMADAMIPPKPKAVYAEPGESEEVRLNDGTTRLHNPSYPGPMKKGRGRPVGWRKNKDSMPPAPIPCAPFAEALIQPAIDAVQEVIAKAPEDPSFANKEEVKAAIHELNRVKGFEVAKSALAKFGATHLNDVAIADFKALVIHCEELKNG